MLACVCNVRVWKKEWVCVQVCVCVCVWRWTCGCWVHFANLGETYNVWWEKDMEAVLAEDPKKMFFYIEMWPNLALQLTWLHLSSFFLSEYAPVQMCGCGLDLCIIFLLRDCGHSSLYCEIEAIKGTIRLIFHAMCMAAYEFPALLKLN